MQSHPMWLNQLMNKIGVEFEAPSYAYLTKLLRAFLANVPFENASKIYYFSRYEQLGWYAPPIETFVEHLITKDMGGICFTNNAGLHLMLRELGFSSYMVRYNTNHTGIIVTLDDTLYYVDVGTGAVLDTPVNLNNLPFEYERYGWQITLSKLEEADGMFQHRLRFGQTDLNWTFTIKEKCELESFFEIIEENSVPGESLFMSILRLQRWQPERKRNLSLVNRTLVIHEDDGSVHHHKISSTEEMESVMRDEFELPNLPIREVIQSLEQWGFDLFPQD